MMEKKIPNEIYYIDNISSQLTRNMLHLASLPFSSFPYKHHLIVQKKIGRKRQKNREKIDKEWKKTKKNALEILKKILFPLSRKPTTKKKKSIFPFRVSQQGWGRFLITTPISFAFTILQTSYLFTYEVLSFLLSFILLYCKHLSLSLCP